MKCPRCDWRSDPDDARSVKNQLRDHAVEVAHPACCVCRTVLPLVDPVTCEECLTNARLLLSEIYSMWLELPAHLGRAGGSGFNIGGRGGSDGAPPPGGDALVLLGPGSEGLAEDGQTTRDGDAPSVAYELTWWEAEWRSARGDTAARPARLSAATRRAVGYLEVQTRWAAQHHPGFADYASDLRILHGRMERATGRARAVVKANASCFDCGGQLVRKVNAATGLEDEHRGPDGEPRPVVTCDRCRKRYSTQEYLLALRQARRSGLEGWVPISTAAKATHRSVETLESWVKRALITAVCRVADKRKLVWWPDVEERIAKSKRRKAS